MLKPLIFIFELKPLHALLHGVALPASSIFRQLSPKTDQPTKTLGFPIGGGGDRGPIASRIAYGDKVGFVGARGCTHSKQTMGVDGSMNSGRSGQKDNGLRGGCTNANQLNRLLK